MLLQLTTSSTILSLGIAVGAIVVIAIGKIIKHYTRVATKIREHDPASNASDMPSLTAIPAPMPVPMKSTANVCFTSPQTPLRSSVQLPATPLASTPIADDLDALYDSDESSHSSDEKGGSSSPSTPVVVTNNTTPSISPKTGPITPVVSAPLTPPPSSVRGVINDWENKNKSPVLATPSPSASNNGGSTTKGRVKQVAVKFEKKKAK